MGRKTKISWCNSTWSPVTGCLHGCEYCYARRIAERFSGNITGAETVKRITIADGKMIWDLLNPIHKTDGKISPYPCGFIPTFHRYRLDEPQKWTKGRNIFVCSMADLFGEWVPDEWIEEVFAACEKAPQHNYLFLTKNPKRYISLARSEKLPQKDNMWYGSTITSMEEYFSSKSTLNTFLSIEPMFAPISPLTIKDVKWIIIGAETGNRKGRVIPKREWMENIVNERRKAEIPIFMKESLAEVWGEPLIQEYPEKLSGLAL